MLKSRVQMVGSRVTIERISYTNHLTCLNEKQEQWALN